MVRVATLWNEIENPNWSETGRRKGEEEDEDENNVAPLSSNGKSITIHRSSNNHHFPFSYSLRRDGDGDHDSTPPAIIDTRKRSQQRRFSLLRQRKSWEVAANESSGADGFSAADGVRVWGLNV